jgi:hypothetical protein
LCLLKELVYQWFEDLNNYEIGSHSLSRAYLPKFDTLKKSSVFELLLSTTIISKQ